MRNVSQQLPIAAAFCALLLATAAAPCTASDKPASKPRGQVEVNSRPLKPDRAKLAALGLQPGDLEAPVATAKTALTYPESALQARVQGHLALQCVIETDGSVDQCAITRSLEAACDKAAILGIQQWKYTPTRVKGVATPAYLDIDVNFRLDKSERKR